MLTQLGENVTDTGDIEAVSDHYTEVLDRIRADGLPAHISVKPTHLGLDVSRDACAAALERLVDHAEALGSFVWIDMEGSSYTDATLELFREVAERHANVGVCLQAYLYRTATDLEALQPLRPTIRLVKGAYREPPSIAFPKKADVDDHYFELAKRLLRAEAAPRAGRHGIATHDLELIERIRRHAEERGRHANGYEIQMLYGIRREDQERLAREGAAVRVLISYGDAWFPWYMRRLAERPANLWFVVRSMVGG